MAYKHTRQITRDEHATIGGVDAKKVFVIDDAGNQITDFGGITPQAFRLDDVTTADVTYLGLADIATTTSAASWQIRKMDESSGLVITWADGDDEFDNVWDNRASLSYS